MITDKGVDHYAGGNIMAIKIHCDNSWYDCEIQLDSLWFTASGH
jgi:hypothetical protein